MAKGMVSFARDLMNERQPRQCRGIVAITEARNKMERRTYV